MNRNADCCVNIDDEIPYVWQKIPWPEIMWRICMGDECTEAKIHCAPLFKGHSLGGSSIASLYVSMKCTVAFAHAGRATRWALSRFLVMTSPLTAVRGITTSVMYVCQLTYYDIAKHSRSNFTKVSVHVTCGRVSILLWRECNTSLYFRFGEWCHVLTQYDTIR